MLCSSSGSRFSSYPWSLACSLARVWRNAVGLAWGDILPGWWLPGLRAGSFGHASKSGSREACPQTCSKEKVCSRKLGRRPGLPQTPNPAIAAFKQFRTRRCFDSQAGWLTSGRVPYPTAPVNECPIFAFSRSPTGSTLPNKVPSHCHTLKGFPQYGSFLWA